jgi:hypothetical protein
MRRLQVNWQAPHYEEIKMDAEIGSYQPDSDTPPDGYDEPRCGSMPGTGAVVCMNHAD